MVWEISTPLPHPSTLTITVRHDFSPQPSNVLCASSVLPGTFALNSGPGSEGKVIPLQDSVQYKEDWLDIRYLNENKRLSFMLSNRTHLEIPTNECRSYAQMRTDAGAQLPAPIPPSLVRWLHNTPRPHLVKHNTYVENYEPCACFSPSPPSSLNPSHAALQSTPSMSIPYCFCKSRGQSSRPSGHAGSHLTGRRQRRISVADLIRIHFGAVQLHGTQYQPPLPQQVVQPATHVTG